MANVYIVTVIAQLLSGFGEVSTTVAERYVPVEASGLEEASIAAVKWFGDNLPVHLPVYDANANPS